MVQRKRHGWFHGLKPSRSSSPKSYKIVCVGCGKEADISREARRVISMLNRSI